MTWLMSQMWIYLGAAALLGLLFGAGLRGLLLRGKMRRAEVELGVTQTELDQARTEIEGLYSAQRRLAGADGVDMSAEIAERDSRVAALGGELASAKAELEALRNQPAPDLASGAAGAALGAVAAAAVSGGDDGAAAAERDQLKAQIGVLEGELNAARTQRDQAESDLQTARADLDTAQQAAPAEITTEPVASISDAGESTDADKMRWQNEYLQTRVQALQARFGVTDDDTLDPQPVATPGPSLVTDAEPVDGEEERETPDEELARLRWRNRYLEGRLAYLEEERSRDPDVPALAATATAAVATATALVEPAPVEAAPEVPEPEPEPVAPVFAEPEPEPEVQPEPEPVAPTVAEVPTTVEPIPAPEPQPEPQPEPTLVTASPAPEASQAAPEKPAAFDKPNGGKPDDLTQIGGVGPMIADVLHSLGIYHFEQIAAWTPQNIAWVDQYMSFEDRVLRENWVEQAKTLLNSMPA
ncbi:MAG: hypothetical protein AAF216_09560 [Pseudomonadota bacterium]